MICPPDHTHATKLTCYTAHKCRCDPCRRHYSRYQRATRATQGVDVTVDAAPTRLRLQALAVLGYSAAQIADWTGINRGQLHYYRNGRRQLITPEIANKVADAYRRTISQLPPKPSKAAITRRHALAAGWLGPLDLDLPQEGNPL